MHTIKGPKKIYKQLCEMGIVKIEYGFEILAVYVVLVNDCTDDTFTTCIYAQFRSMQTHNDLYRYMY